jgi:hypothetical protein
MIGQPPRSPAQPRSRLFAHERVHGRPAARLDGVVRKVFLAIAAMLPVVVIGATASSATSVPASITDAYITGLIGGGSSAQG